MCKLKCMGGLGFKDLKIFNLALLGKQIWRMLKSENSLLAKVYKAKYHPNSSILEARLGLQHSFAWRSLWSSKSLILNGMVWRVGNGERIKIRDDPWLLNGKKQIYFFYFGS